VRKKITKKKVIITVVCIVLGLIVFPRMFGGKKKSDAHQTTVRVENVCAGDLVEIVVAPGQIEPRRKVDLSAKIAARIVELPFDEGQEVKKGDVLIKLDSRDLESRLRSVQASYEAQRAQMLVDQESMQQQKSSLRASAATLEQANSVFARQEKLLKSKDISQATFDEYECKMEEQKGRHQASEHALKAAVLRLKVMEHNLKSSKEKIEQAKEELSYTTIVSPMDGIVTRINAEEGEMVMTGTMNNAGTIIMQVADLSQMLLVVQVDESDIGKLKIDQTARIRVQAYWGHEFIGTVTAIALTHDVSSSRAKYYKTEILIQPDEAYRLFSGLTADVDIETLRHEKVIKVPTQSVVSRKAEDLPLKVRKDNPNVDMDKTDALVVYRIIDGKAIATPVEIGQSDMSHIIIRSGLSEDDQIVIGPYKVLDKLKHNQKVVDEAAEDKDEAADDEA
jgi:HlyD family secretion protein